MGRRPSPRRDLRAAARILAAMVVLLPSAVRSAAPGGAEGLAVKAADLLSSTGKLLLWVEQHDKDVASSAARTVQAEADLSTSRLYPNPTFEADVAGFTLGTTNPPGLGFSDTSRYDVGVAETIEIGKRGPRIESARLQREAARESYWDVVAQRIAEARLALGRAVYLKARQEILEQSLDAARRGVDLEKVRFEQGDLSGNDFDRLVLDTTSLELDGARNRSEYEGALAGCRSALAAECDLDGARPEDLDAGMALQGIDDQAAALLTQRPDLQALQRQRESALQDRRLATHRGIPDPTLGVSYTRDHLVIAGNQPESLGASLTFPLPIFDRGQHDAAKAAARAVEAEATAEAVERRARADLETLLRRKAFLEATLERLERESVPRSAAVLDTTVKAFDQGELSMTDLLLARRTHISLLLNQTDVRFEFFTVRNELRRVLGLDAAEARQAAAAGGRS